MQTLKAVVGDHVTKRIDADHYVTVVQGIVVGLILLHALQVDCGIETSCKPINNQKNKSVKLIRAFKRG